MANRLKSRHTPAWVYAPPMIERIRRWWLFWTNLPRYLDEDLARRRASGDWDS